MEPVLKSTQRTAHLKFGKKAQKLTALASISTLLFLAGCTSTTAAVTVGKNSTSVARVQESVTNILNARKGVDTTGMNLLTGADLATSQAQFFLISQLLEDEGKSIGITVTPAEATKEKNVAIKQVGGAAALPKALVGANIDEKNLDTLVVNNSHYLFANKTLNTNPAATATSLPNVPVITENFFILSLNLNRVIFTNNLKNLI